MFNVLFWFRINNMSRSLEIKIQVVILMAKHESPVMVICQLQLFTFPRVVNKHNCRTWGATNPFTNIEAAMSSSKSEHLMCNVQQANHWSILF